MPLKMRTRADQQRRGGADRCAGSEGREALEANFHREGYHESYPMLNNNFIGSTRTIEHSD